MVNSRERKVEQLLILCLGVFCCFNQLVIVHIHSIANLFPMVFALCAAPILFKKVFVRTTQTFEKEVNVLGMLLVFAAVISLIRNRFVLVVRNSYIIIAIVVLFLLMYDSFYDQKAQFMKGFFTVIVALVFACAVASILLLYFRVSIHYVLHGLNRWLGIDGYTHRFCGVTGNSNNLTRFMFSGILLSGPLFVWYKHRVSKIILGICDLAMAYVIFLGDSRGINYAIYFGIAIAGMAWAFINSKNWKELVCKMLIGGIAAAILVVSMSSLSTLALNNIIYYDSNVQEIVPPSEIEQIPVPDPAPDPEVSKDTEGPGPGIISREDDEFVKADFSNGRFQIWKLGVQATLHERPLVGFTAANIKESLCNYADENHIEISEPERAILGHMHNQFLQMFVGWGVFGLIAVGMFYFYFVKLTIKVIFGKKKKTDDKGLLLWYIFGASTLALYSMVEASFFLSFDNELMDITFFIILALYTRIINDNYGNEYIHDKLLSKISQSIIFSVNKVKGLFLQSMRVKA